MDSKKEIQHVYLVGAKSLGAYGGYETFVYKLTEYHQNKENIKYHVACKANGDGCMDESKFEGVTKINDHEFEFHNAHCFKIDVPQIGSAQAIYLKNIGVDKLNYDCEVDTLVIGSDEVFNCLQPYPVGYSKQLFGDGYAHSKIVSYAASFGSTRYEDLVDTGIAHEIKTMLSRFAAISVRDENSAHIVRQLLGYSPEIHMDPVLMYDFTQEIAEYTTYERDYIILYAYTGRLSREEENYIKKFAKRHNKRIICVGHYSNIADKNIICNPLYVFSYFKNADYVITDTFHGTVFSIKMNTKFCTLVRDSNRNKLEALLNKLDKLDRKVEKLEDILLNFILIPVIGVYGAALATCISYIAVFMFRVFHTRKYIKYDIMYKEFILGSLLMLVSAILMFVDGMKGFLLQLVILLIGFTVFSKTWIPMLQFFLNKIQRKRVS